MAHLPDLRADQFRGERGRIVLGRDLVLMWQEITPGAGFPTSIEFVACEADGTRLAVLGEVPTALLGDAMMAEMVVGCSSMARKIYPGQATVSFVETPRGRSV